MTKFDFDELYFDRSFILYICSIFSKHVLLRTHLERTNSQYLSVTLKIFRGLKSLAFLDKCCGYVAGDPAENQILKYHTMLIFKKSYPNLAGSLMAKLSKLPSRCAISFFNE